MKKKLLMAAAIAFAVFAIPYGSSALSTVSVASENNTVATPAPTPVVDTAKVVENIEKITVDASNPNSAVAALQQIGTSTLKAAIEQSMVSGNGSNSVADALYNLEEEYAKAIGLENTDIKEFDDNVDDDLAIGFTGAVLNGATSVYVSVPENKPAVPSSVGTPYYIDFKLQNSNGTFDGSLAVPVVVDMTVPAGMDANKVVVYHFVNGKVETIAPNVYNDEKWGTSIVFVVDHFSTFAVAEVESTEAASGSDNAFERYRDNIASEIANAKDGATVKISRDKNINALPNDIMQALYKKQTVALELEYTFEGNEYTVTIPAGKAEDNAIEWYGPLYLQMRYGK